MAPLLTKARGCRTGSWRPHGRLRRCGRRRSGLPARLIVRFFAILCVANLKYGSLKSLTTKPRIWSRRWRRCWGSSTGTPWWRPARAWGPKSSLLLMLTAVLINKMILDMYLCKLLLLQSNRMIFSCAVSFESKKKNIPDLSLPPCRQVELLYIGISPIRLFSHRSCVSNSIFHLERLNCKNQVSGVEIQSVPQLWYYYFVSSSSIYLRPNSDALENL